MAFDKGEVVLRQGDVSTHLHFVTSGLLRYYYLAQGVEYTGQFMSPGMFIADLASFTTRQPADQTIDALDRTTTLALSRQAIQEAMDADHGIERFVRIVIEQAFAGSQRRSANLLIRSPEERYDWLCANRPDVIRLVPQYILASYLGVTPESLSRIRKRRAQPTKG